MPQDGQDGIADFRLRIADFLLDAAAGIIYGSDTGVFASLISWAAAFRISVMLVEDAS